MMPHKRYSPPRRLPHVRLAGLLALMLLTVLPAGVEAQLFSGLRESWKQHTQADPLTLSGTFGCGLASSWNNKDVLAYVTPFSATGYLDLTFNIYGFAFPFHIDLVNVSQTQFSFPHPTLNINTTPTIGRFRFHLGSSSMHFSNYNYSGMTFTGGGVEYNGKWFRAAGFYGTLTRATKFGPDDRSAIQYYADSLLGLNLHETTTIQFTRYAYGAKIGFGGSNTFIDFSLLRAADDSTSLPTVWYGDNGDTTLRDSVLAAKENLAAGISGRLAFGKHVAISANLGASLYTSDMSASKLTDLVDSLGGHESTAGIVSQVKPYTNLLKKVAWLYVPRTSSTVRFAGDAALSWQWSRVSGALTYRFVQADYTSLGANQFSQNNQGFGGNTTLNLFNRNRAFINITGFAQRDNLDHKQTYTNHVLTYAASYSQSFGEVFRLSASYNGIKQDQFDGLEQVNDTTRTDQVVSTISLSPNIQLSRNEQSDHSINLNFNRTANRNLNPLSDNSINLATTTLGAGYDISLNKRGVGIGINYDYSSSRAVTNSYTAHTVSVNGSYNIIKKENMRLRATASGVFSYSRDAENAGAASVSDAYGAEGGAVPIGGGQSDYSTRKYSFSARAGLDFNYRQRHILQLNAALSNYSENIIIGQRIGVDVDLRATLTYSYTFATRIIKHKTRKTDTSESTEEPIID